MTGSDIALWLDGIWDDLLNPDTADIPLLLLKLFVLYVVLFFGWQFGRMFVQSLWSVVGPVVQFVWRIVMAPVRLPVQAVKRLYRPVVRRRHERQQRREQLAEAERAEAMRCEQERRHAEALATVRKILDVD